jgi:ATP-binding cassette subfamily B protein
MAVASSFASDAPSGGVMTRVRDIWGLMRSVARVTPRHSAIWVALALVGSLVTPIQLWATANIANGIQEVANDRSVAPVWWFAAVWLVSLAIQIMAGNGEFYVEAVVQERGGERIALDTLRRASGVDLIAFDHQPLHDRIALLLTESETKARDVIHHALQLARVLPGFASWTIVLVVFDWRMLLLALLPSIPSMYAWFSGGSVYWDVYKEQTQERRLAQTYATFLTDRDASREVRMLGLEETFTTRWERHFWQTARDLRRRGLLLGARQRGSSILSSTMQVGGLTWYIATLDRDISAGTAIVVVTSYFAVSYGLYGLADPINQLGQASGFARELRSFIDVPAAETAMPRRDLNSGRIELEHVRFTWPGATRPVIDDVSLSIAPGETIALVGENGAGKSTLVKLLLGLYRPDSGRVLQDGDDLALLPEPDVRSRFSAVFQSFIHYPLTARENVALDGGLDDAAFREAMTTVDLPHLADAPETLLAPDLGGTDLSGGQWQRIAIARAAVRQAAVLCLDEPTAALDPMAEVHLFRQFTRLAEGRTTVLVSHRLGMARLADRVVVLEQGRIVESGTHDQLVGRDSRYREMWESQARWYR